MSGSAPPSSLRGLPLWLSPLSPPQGASALFDMIEYYESATHLNISFNKHIGTRGWQAAAHMMRKVGASPAASTSFQGGGSSGIEGSRCFVRAPSSLGISDPTLQALCESCTKRCLAPGPSWPALSSSP